MSTKRSRKSRKERWVIALVTLLFLSTGAVAGVKCFLRPPEIDPPPTQSLPQPVTPVSGSTTQEQTPEPVVPQLTRRESCYTILVSGTDDGNGGCDTNILVLFDAGRKVIHCVSLPRDTLIDVDWTLKKLNNAYAHGGMEEMSQQVARMLGIPVDYTVKVDLKAFQELVDAIDGVYFDVPVDMDYDDPIQDLHIHIQKGPQQLNGEDALKVVRFRQNNDGTGYLTADIGRIGTQQKFLKAVAAQTLTPANLDKISVFANIFFTYVETDLSLGNLAWMGATAIQMGTENITFHTLPGDGAGWYQGVGYYILDREKTLEMVNTYLNPYEQTLSLTDMAVLSPAD